MSKPKPRYECLNIDIDVVKIRDREQSVVADIYFKRTGIYCNTCKTDTCTHIDYVLTVPRVQDIIRKKIKEGWNIPEPDL